MLSLLPPLFASAATGEMEQLHEDDGSQLTVAQQIRRVRQQPSRKAKQ